jgi:hypothetical protein
MIYQREHMKKLINITERQDKYIRYMSEKLEIAQAEYLRRIIDKDIEEKLSEDNKKQ